MDTDIYAMMEYKSWWNDERTGPSYWINGGNPQLSRDYDLFAVLVGVRNRIGVEPIAPADRRFRTGEVEEEDASTEFLFLLSHDKDAHTPSWVTLQELLAYDVNTPIYDEGRVGWRSVLRWSSRNWNRLLEELTFIRDRKDLKNDEVRVVFYFDN